MIAHRCRHLVCAGVLGLAACTTWRPMPNRITPDDRATLPHGLRVTRSDGSRVVLLYPFFRGETLYGTWYRDTLAIPPDSISGVERERFSVLRTVALLAAIPLAAYAYICRDGCPQAVY